MGVFPAVSLVHQDLIEGYGVKLIGTCAGVEERFFAIAAHRKVQHPLVQRLLKG
jgi:LysR family transcriptional activator of nhaA